MAKTSATKKTSVNPPAMRTTASSATANAEPAIPANDNQSKYQPSNDADMNTKLLDAGDGVMKLFTDAVKDLYWAENHLVKALPKMISSASATSLKNALSKHLEETIIHVDRLEQVFDMLGKKPQAKKCDAMEGLTKEGEGVIEDTDAGTPARDLGIIMASQKVEHYEISAYTGLSKIAEKLGLTDIAATLTETLAEEQIADETLAGIADTGISFSSNDSQ